MSIWSSWEEIGYDMVFRSPKPHRGQVRSYASGWSNHYPTTDGAVEQPAAVGVASMPVWCVPGHEDDYSDDTVGPWLRLEVASAQHSWKDGGKPTGLPEGAAVVMDEEAARSLAADLLAWADRPKALPKEDVPEQESKEKK